MVDVGFRRFEARRRMGASEHMKKRQKPEPRIWSQKGCSEGGNPLSPGSIGTHGRDLSPNLSTHSFISSSIPNHRTNGYLAFIHKPPSQKPNHENSFDEKANRKAETLAHGYQHPRSKPPSLRGLFAHTHLLTQMSFQRMKNREGD